MLTPTKPSISTRGSTGSCAAESQLPNYGKKKKGTSGPQRVGLKSPGGVWGSDDLHFVPISDLSTTFLTCKGKGPHTGIQGTATS